MIGSGLDSDLYTSGADWVSPGTTYPTNDGTVPVILNDTDHSYFWTSLLADGPQAQKAFVWQNFTLGNSALFMDPYLTTWPGRNSPGGCQPGPNCTTVDTVWDLIRKNIGYMLDYANIKLDLARMTPQPGLTSTGFVLANAAAAGAEYLAYAPAGGPFSVDVSATTHFLNAEWLNPSTGAVTVAAAVAGGGVRTLTPPFSGDAVLYLVDQAGHQSTGGPAGTVFTDSGLNPGTTYRYQVRAYDAANNQGAPSNTGEATTLPADTIPPSAPSGVAATMGRINQVDLGWNPSTDNVGVASYLIERCQGVGCSVNPGAFTQIGISTLPGFSDPGRSPSTIYAYRVRAVDAAANLSGYSNSAMITTPAAQPQAITLVQHASIDAGTVTSATVTFGTNNTAGNWIAVIIRAAKTGQVFTVRDTVGNVYKKAIQLSEVSDNTALALYYAENIAGGTNAVTASDSITGATLRIAIVEYAGVALVNSLETAGGAQGSTASPSSGQITTGTNGDLILGAVATANPASVMAGSGFILVERAPTAPTSGTRLALEGQIQAAAGPVSAGMTLGVADVWGAIVAAFRPALASPPASR